jgi:hypothetical protein
LTGQNEIITASDNTAGSKANNFLMFLAPLTVGIRFPSSCAAASQIKYWRDNFFRRIEQLVLMRLT